LDSCEYPRHQKKSTTKSTARTPARKTAPPRSSLWKRHERDLWIVLLVVAGLFCLLATSKPWAGGHVVLDALKLFSAWDGFRAGHVDWRRARVALEQDRGRPQPNPVGSPLVGGICGIGHLAAVARSARGVKALGRAADGSGAGGEGLYRSIGLGGAIVC